ncbi:MAG TPA: isoprenylcysteine carboxylmethyltransferase family protein [Actinomycetota bacterium]|jgi:protein-S-isoprenylcysteine O-methyltransferase Ste14
MLAAAALEHLPPAARVLLAATAIALFVVDAGIGWLVGDRTAGPWQSSSRDRGSYQVVAVGTVGGFLLGFAALRGVPDLHWLGNVWIWVIGGLLVAWCGVALRGWAIATLGQSFRRVVTVTAGQQVVTRGPYRFVRHPSYTGLLLAFLGFGLAVDNPLALLGLVVPATAALLYRIRVEEAALEAELGEPYRDFERGRARLVPHVW